MRHAGTSASVVGGRARGPALPSRPRTRARRTRGSAYSARAGAGTAAATACVPGSARQQWSRALRRPVAGDLRVRPRPRLDQVGQLVARPGRRRRSRAGQRPVRDWRVMFDARLRCRTTTSTSHGRRRAVASAAAGREQPREVRAVELDARPGSWARRRARARAGSVRTTWRRRCRRRRPARRGAPARRTGSAY